MIAVLKSGVIDGFMMFLLWLVMVSWDGTGVMFISVPRGDFVELYLFVFIFFVTCFGFCESKSIVCRKLVAGYKCVLSFIYEVLMEVLVVLWKKFDKIDLGVLVESFEVTRAAVSKMGLV